MHLCPLPLFQFYIKSFREIASKCSDIEKVLKQKFRQNFEEGADENAYQLFTVEQISTYQFGSSKYLGLLARSEERKSIPKVAKKEALDLN